MLISEPIFNRLIIFYTLMSLNVKRFVAEIDLNTTISRYDLSKSEFILLNPDKLNSNFLIMIKFTILQAFTNNNLLFVQLVRDYSDAVLGSVRPD